MKFSTRPHEQDDPAVREGPEMGHRGAAAAQRGSSAELPGEGDDSTRRRVASSILEHGPSTAAQLASRLSVTPAAIRRHLTALLADGELIATERLVVGQRGRGRPAKVFALTDQGRGGFEHAYDDLAAQALRTLSTVAGPSAVRAFARERIHGLEQRFAEIAAEQPELEPGEVLARVLTDNGYVASVQPARGGEQLCQHHCPIAHVAEEFPELCEAETQAFADLLGVHVQRLATIAGGDGVCTTNIPDLAPNPDLSTVSDLPDIRPVRPVPANRRKAAR